MPSVSRFVFFFVRRARESYLNAIVSSTNRSSQKGFQRQTTERASAAVGLHSVKPHLLTVVQGGDDENASSIRLFRHAEDLRALVSQVVTVVKQVESARSALYLSR